MLFPIEFLEQHGREFPAWGIEESRLYTRELTKRHYENFLVTSILVPRRLRQDYCNVYAFCRWADDLGDETGNPAESLDLLDWWQSELLAMADGRAHHPVYVALRDTMERHALPTADFEDLIRAFVQDQSVRRYRSHDELLGYCRYSANPVGRLVLRMHGYCDDELFKQSDSICTALQLANHWQDIRRDWEMDRVYIPQDVMASHGYSLELLAEDMANGVASSRCRATIRDLTNRAGTLFSEGLGLATRLKGRLGFEVQLFAMAGLAVLKKIRGQGWDTIASRPVIGKRERTTIVLSAAARRALGHGRGKRRPDALTLEESYEYCRHVARTRARNFYYSFVVLPRKQRDAMCAIYAFMRRSDDIVDDESAPAETRRKDILRWRDGVRSVLAGGPPTDPALAAFRDTVDRFAIPHSYIFELLDGMESDLSDRVYRTFEELYRYCYQAASVVGITTIHVLGFEKQSAISLAEKCGVAFQITNIMRDVAADAAMGRVYFPETELEDFGLSRESLLRLELRSDDQRFQRFMEFQWQRADGYYREAADLLPQLSPAGRPAFWVMVATYRGLLNRIRDVRFAVLKGKVRLPFWKKLWLVARALQLRVAGGIPPFPA